MKKSGTITIFKGKIESDYKGFVGGECTKLEEAIRPKGTVVDDQELKPEHSYGANAGHSNEESQSW